MILIELLFGVMVATFALLLIPFLLLMAGAAGVVLLWVLAPTALLIGLILWLVLPHTLAFVVLVVALLIALHERDRRYHRMDVRRWY